MATSRRSSRQSTAHNGRRHEPDVRRKAEEVVQSVKELGAETKRSARASVEATRDAALEYVDQGKRQVGELQRSIDRQFRDRPLQTLAFTALAGFFCGLLCRRG
jgi:ElaB/YqjD/DUF883 family membrane-anchored ribosome-binding protein